MRPSEVWLVLFALLAAALPSGRAEAADPLPTIELRVASPTQRKGPWTNRLVTEASPYLQLHAHNPVDWLPWGPEAFAEAQRRGVPVFLSVGYAGCHWCLVMEAETFSDPDVAAVLNARFVPVKVDRQERPDVDALYAQALRELIGRNGWPASLFLTPDRVPFSGGTYFPDKPSDGRPSFRQAMEMATRAWDGDRAGLLARAASLRQELAAQALRARGDHLPPASAVNDAVRALASSHDPVHGGWGDKKFPRAPVLELLLDQAALGNEDAIDPLVDALDGMALGALHDQLGGGFHRYTLDPAWRRPHYEKMLYDNAQLASVYLDAWRVLGRQSDRAVGLGTLAWMVTTLWSEDAGAFRSSLSADGDREEGGYYTWTRRQLRAALGRGQGAQAAAVFHVAGKRPAPLWLRSPLTAAQEPLVATLLAARSQRPAPELDDAMVVAWNGLALTALARGLTVQDDPELRRIARRLAGTLLSARRRDGTLPRTLPRTLASQVMDGVVDDHAFVAAGLLDLYEVDPDPRWLFGAGQLGRILQDRFAAQGGGYWFTLGTGTAPLDPTLMARQLQWRDGDEPSGLGRAVLLTQRLAALGAPGIDSAQARETLVRASAYLVDGGGGQHFSSLVRALALLQRGWLALVVVGDPASVEARALVAVHAATRRPGLVLGEASEAGLPAGWSAFRGKSVGAEGVRAYLCRDGECEAPTADPHMLRMLLARSSWPFPVKR